MSQTWSQQYLLHMKTETFTQIVEEVWGRNVIGEELQDLQP